MKFKSRYTEPEVVLQWSLNPEVSGNMMHKIECTDCNSLRRCHIIHQTGLKVGCHAKLSANKVRSPLSLLLQKYFSNRQGYVRACTNCGEPSWFYWRIVAPMPNDQVTN